MMMTRSRHVARSHAPKQLAWCKRSAEDGEMIVQLDPWARLRRKSREVRHFSSKEAIPSFDTRRARATSFDAHKLGWFNSNFRRDDE